MPMTIGNGTIGGLSPGGLPNQTVQQQNLGPGTVGNGPAFSAFLTAVQSVPSAAMTKLQLTTEEFDTNNCYDSVTCRFQPTVPGYYQINGAATFSTIAGGAAVISAIFKNGTEVKRGASMSGGGINPTCPVSALIYMNGTSDYVELHTFQSTGAAQNASNGGAYTYFQGHLARAA